MQYRELLSVMRYLPSPIPTDLVVYVDFSCVIFTLVFIFHRLILFSCSYSF